MSTWDSKLPEFKRRAPRAIEAGLRAAAMIVRNEVMRRLRGGFKSGAFATGESVNAVTISVDMHADGEGDARVGTHLLYNLFWELGHMNLYTRQWERKEIWGPAFRDTQDQQVKAFNRAFKREIGKEL